METDTPPPRPPAAPRVVAVGHAIVDVLAASDDFLVASLGLVKGTMTLVDGAEAVRIHAALGAATEASGGSAANTAACLASLGTSCTFVGKVAADRLGRVFSGDIRAAGVGFDGPPAGHLGAATGRCLVMVTPDGERTMCTDLGVAAMLGPGDVDPALVASAGVLYVEGYLYGKEPTARAVDAAIAAARPAGTLVAFSASDPAWVELKRDAISSVLDRVDLLFANEAEALLLAGRRDVDEALDGLAGRCPTVVVTLGERGCLVASGTARAVVAAAPVAQVVDTTGAGDSFAAGYLHGVMNGLGPEACARIGALAAAEVVGHMGARPQSPLRQLVAAAGLTAGAARVPCR